MKKISNTFPDSDGRFIFNPTCNGPGYSEFVYPTRRINIRTSTGILEKQTEYKISYGSGNQTQIPKKLAINSFFTFSLDEHESHIHAYAFLLLDKSENAVIPIGILHYEEIIKGERVRTEVRY